MLGKFCKVDNIIGMENPYYYRNKVHAVFDTDKKGNVNNKRTGMVLGDGEQVIYGKSFIEDTLYEIELVMRWENSK